MKKTIEVEEETLPAVIAAVRADVTRRRELLAGLVDDSSFGAQRHRRVAMLLEHALEALGGAQTAAKQGLKMPKINV